VEEFSSLWRVDTRQRRGKRSRVWTYLPRDKVFQTNVLAAHWVAENFHLVSLHMRRSDAIVTPHYRIYNMDTRGNILSVETREYYPY
jgi:hypothetical protein